MSAAAAAQSGAESVIVGRYRLISQLRDRAPILYESLTSVNVDVTFRPVPPRMTTYHYSDRPTSLLVEGLKKVATAFGSDQ